MDAFKGREVANILHIMAKMCYRPWDLIRTLLLFERLRGGRRHWRALQEAARGKHAVGVCDDGAGARGRGDAGAGGAGGGSGGHVQRTARGKHAVGVCDDGERARGRGDSGAGGAGGGGGGHV